jgi:hypothetical protein
MSEPSFPSLPQGISYFADWRDLVVAVGGLVSIALLIIWWSQQTRHWHRVLFLSFLAAFGLTFASIYLFEVPPYYAGCSEGCTGWRGYPLPVARITRDGITQIGLLDFGLNLLLLWLLVLLATLIGRLVAVAVNWENRATRVRLLIVVALLLVPWAMLPRYLDPPQPVTTGEELRLVNNAQRAAESTYRITGAVVQRLALEDVRQLTPNPLGETAPDLEAVRSQVCLRGYTYFYIPWRRYRIDLEPTGVTAVDFTELPLEGSCWQEIEG